MNLVLIIATIAAGQATQAARAPAVERFDVGRADWASFQPLNSHVALPTVEMVDAVQNILRSRQCPSIRQSPARFDITVNYAVQFADRRARRVLVQDIGCPPIEQLVDAVVGDMIRNRLVDIPRGNAALWYGSAINFNLDTH